MKYVKNKSNNIEILKEIPFLLSGLFTFSKIMSNLFLRNFEDAQSLSVINNKLYKINKPITASLFINVINIEDEIDDKKISDATERYMAEINIIISDVEKKYDKSKLKNSEFNLFENAKKFKFIHLFSANFNKEL